MRLTLRSQVFVCGRISEYVCVRALHCLWTRYPCAAARRKKPVVVCGAPTHSQVSACVRINVITDCTHAYSLLLLYTHRRTQTRDISVGVMVVCVQCIILCSYSITVVAGVPTKTNDYDLATRWCVSRLKRQRNYIKTTIYFWGGP